MAEANNKILLKMLDRLFAGMATGPNLNCRPHSSRQRVDVSQVTRLKDLSPEEVLWQLLGPDREAKLTARVAVPKRRVKNPDRRPSPNGKDAKSAGDGEEPLAEELTPQEKEHQQAWTGQQSFLGKLRILADEARTFEQDTGVHVLNVGFPLLSLPPGSTGAAGDGVKRVLAPVAFIPVAITIRSGPTPVVEIACKGEGIDRVSPNVALLAWLEKKTGKSAPDLFADDRGEEPWREIGELVRHVATTLSLPVPALFQAGETQAPSGEEFHLAPAPRSDEDGRPGIVPAAVLGLFPTNNLGLLRDTQAMAAGEALDGPVQSFIQAGVGLDQPVATDYDHEAWSGPKRPRVFAEERFVLESDPCQSRAVRSARESQGLVIHGPPGTGKSQTIANIIGDHLARGERVLMVCDKRTALDVVARRLEHLGLGPLCALVHDPRHDQRDLYRAIREQLEKLTEVTTDSRAGAKLAKVDRELEQVHAELSACWSQLMEKGADGLSFHELTGQWLSAGVPGTTAIDPGAISGAGLEEFEQHRADVLHLLERARQADYAENPWVKAAGTTLEAFLMRRMDEVRSAMKACVEAARSADATADPAIPPFASQLPLDAQGRARSDLAAELQLVVKEVDAWLRSRWVGQDPATVRRARQRLAEVTPQWEAVRAGSLDPELAVVAAASKTDTAAVAREIGAIESYLAVAPRWYAFLYRQRQAEAARVLGRYGLPPGVSAAERLRGFLLGLRDRMVLQAVTAELAGKPPSTEGLAPDEVLDRVLSQCSRVLALLEKVNTEPNLTSLAVPVRQVLADAGLAAGFVGGLQKSAARASALMRLRETLVKSELFDAAWLNAAGDEWFGGRPVAETLTALNDRLDTLEGVLRIRSAIASFPAWLRSGVQLLLPQGMDAEQGVSVLHQAVLAAEITKRLAASPQLQTLDGRRLQGNFARIHGLEEKKRGLVRDAILDRWVGRQKERLLVSTGSRLSGLGADLRRRLTMRGERALRLRQVIAVGQGIEGGDPLFDLCPVWMASPQTVAQVFPRQPLFDVVIFDEASQCRLEEALPVLTRARRVVIAGDPRQLPPTRFFETAIAASEDEEIETDQQLFEVHQGEVEDLLGAALGLDIRQSYLDVHYRSRNADLIEFSNEQFYSSRLQPIPGHPSHRARFAPITLYRANGVYEGRSNPVEAEQVCRIVRDLLKRAEPPSIGIACFNLAQRDLIVEKLDELAEEDREFAAGLAEARVRQGTGSFEGLFVKNLENVQGDERDHMIISTTYGPDPQGRFYRRFGPLGRAEGGRRLNVLVTRAREEVHLVTSIPPAVYRGLPPVPSGKVPGGGWLLFAYLAYAEQLAELYETAHQAGGETGRPARVHVRKTQSPSEFATALAHELAANHQTGSDVFWGNEGFCVDLALHHPRDADDVTIGILCDGTRFARAEDPVEWDVFRTAVLEGQGWKLHRLWTPQFFRDPRGAVKAILQEASDLLSCQQEKNTIKVARKP